MAEPRARTLVERMGFKDPDLTSPAHDAMVLWIAGHVLDYLQKRFDPWEGLPAVLETASRAIQAQLGRHERECARLSEERRPRIRREYDEVGGWKNREETPAEVQERTCRIPAMLEKEQAAMRNIARLIKDGVRRPVIAPPLKILKTEFESTVASGSYIIGFVDVLVNVAKPRLEVCGVDREYGKTVGFESEPFIEFGYPSSHALPDATYCFEAKPAIRSMGELLRQIRAYQEYLGTATFVVVSPDTRFRAAIEGQGILFWESPRFDQ